MDYPSEERLGIALLGELDPCHVGRTVHGGRRNLWRCHIRPISGRQKKSPLDMTSPEVIINLLTLEICATEFCH